MKLCLVLISLMLSAGVSVSAQSDRQSRVEQELRALVRTWDEAFVKGLTMPAIVMPGGDPAHPRAIGLRVAELMPNATLLDGWKQPENGPGAIDTVRKFLKSHVPA